MAMLMVVGLHYLNHADTLLRLDAPISSVRIAGSLVQSFLLVAVNVWVLISGFFLSTAEYSVKRILRVIAEVYFYTLGVTAALLLTNSVQINVTDSVYKTIQFLLPFESEHYWFATAYILMLLLSPIMNMGVRYLNRQQLKITILGMLIWHSLIRSFVPVLLATDDYGYGFGWFCTLYLIAAYIKRYDVGLFATRKRSLFVYGAGSVVSFLIMLVLFFLHEGRGGLHYYFTMPTHYNFVVCLLGALGLFQFFRLSHLPEGRIARMARAAAPFSFGVYLLHEHVEIRNRWVGWLESLIGEVPRESVGGFIIHMIASVGIVFLTGLFVDWVRSVLFAYLQRVLRNTKPAAFIRETDVILRTKREGGRRWYDRADSSSDTADAQEGK